MYQRTQFNWDWELAFDGIANLENLLSNCGTGWKYKVLYAKALPWWALDKIINYSLLANSRSKLPSAIQLGQVGVWLARRLNSLEKKMWFGLTYSATLTKLITTTSLSGCTGHWAGRSHVLGAGHLTHYKPLDTCYLECYCASWYSKTCLN